MARDEIAAIGPGARGLGDAAPRTALLAGVRGHGGYIAGSTQLDARLRLLVSQLAAQLSGCRWCIEQGRHPALVFAEAVTWYRDAAGGMPAELLAELRRHCSEPEIAALTMAAAAEHFFDPTSGALGADAGRTVRAPSRTIARPPESCGSTCSRRSTPMKPNAALSKRCSRASGSATQP